MCDFSFFSPLSTIGSESQKCFILLLQLLRLNFIFNYNCLQDLPGCVKFKDKMVQNRYSELKKCQLLLKAWCWTQTWSHSKCDGQMDAWTRQVGRQTDMLEGEGPTLQTTTSHFIPSHHRLTALHPHVAPMCKQTHTHTNICELMVWMGTMKRQSLPSVVQT